MPRYRITFRKIVYGNTGHARDICQRTVEVDAHDSESAQAAAIECFCELEHIADWLNHADRLEIARVEQALIQQAVGGRETRRAA